jgi:hypothetical protein
MILLTALSLAFCWVEIVNPRIVNIVWSIYETKSFFSGKPFTCCKCMTGWFALILGCVCYGWFGLFFLPLGVFIGAMFEAIKMRWL